MHYQFIFPFSHIEKKRNIHSDKNAICRRGHARELTVKKVSVLISLHLIELNWQLLQINGSAGDVTHYDWECVGETTVVFFPLCSVDVFPAFQPLTAKWVTLFSARSHPFCISSSPLKLKITNSEVSFEGKKWKRKPKEMSSVVMNTCEVVFPQGDVLSPPPLIWICLKVQPWKKPLRWKQLYTEL